MVIRDRLAKGVVWLVAAKLAINSLALISTLVLAHLLVPEDFGLVALATAMLSILSSITDLSLASALIHHKNPTDAHFHTSWTLNALRASCVGLLFSALGPVAAHFYHEPRLINIMLVIGLSIMISGFNNPKVILLKRNLVFWQEFALSVSQKIMGFAVCVGIALVYKSYWALVGGLVASQLCGVLVSYIVLPFKPKISFKHTLELFNFSFWLMLGQLVNTLNWKLDPLLISGFLGHKPLGYYTVGDNLAAMVTREAIGPLDATLFPGFSQLNQDLNRLRSAYTSAQTLISSIAMPIGIGFALVAQPLVLLVMGEKWLSIVEIIQVLSCIYAFQTLNSPVHPLAMALGQTKLLFKRDLLSFAIRVPMIIIGLYLGGLMGVVYSRIATNVTGITINLMLVKKLIGLTVVSQLLANQRSLLSTLSMALVVTALKKYIGQDSESLMLTLKIAQLVLAGCLAYITTHYLLWTLAHKPAGPEQEVLKLLSKLMVRLKRGNSAM